MSASVEFTPEHPTDSGLVFRLPKKYLAIGLASTVLFAVMGCTSAVVAWTNVDGSFPHPKEMAIGFGCFWSGWTLVGIYLVLAYLREELTVTPSVVQSVGCFRTRTLDISATTRLAWRRFPAEGRLVLYGDDRRLVVYFGTYGRLADRILIAFFRAAAPEPMQEGWERFTEWRAANSR